MPSPREAEVAGEHMLRQVLGCEWTRRALRTKFARVDFFAADIIGRDPLGGLVWAQVTKSKQSGEIRTRRRKLEPFPYGPTERVLLLQLVERPDPVNAGRLEFFFRVHELETRSTTWAVWGSAVPVPRAWFKARGAGGD